MSADLLGVLLALIVSAGTAGVGLVTAWKRAPAENIGTLTARIAAVEKRESALTDWQVAARLYILALRNTMADHGIQSPPPPPELNITTED